MQTCILLLRMIKITHRRKKYNMKKKIEKNDAITLIALVITIVVLLILAGITIGTLTGDNGLIKNARKCKRTS